MKRLICLFVCIVTSCACFASTWPRPPHIEKALTYGADTKVIFHVVDDEGKSVEGATVVATFALNGKGCGVKIDTNKEGEMIAEEKSVGEVIYSVGKKGYYETRGTIDFGDRFNWAPSVKDGKWQPYGKTYKVVLKPIKNPVSLPILEFYEKLKIGIPIGFDLKVGDYVKPHGLGEVADFVLVVAEESTSLWRRKAVLILRFPHALDGVYRKEQDLYSSYRSDYTANTHATYQKKLVFIYDTLDPQKRVDTSLTDKQYLVLRTRTKVDEKGKLVEAHYSKIYGELAFTHQELFFKSVMNPKPNDTNLEAIEEWAYETKAANPEIYKRITQGSKRSK